MLLFRWRRIVGCRRGTCLVVRALVIRLHWRIGHVRPRIHPLRRSLDSTLRRAQRRAHRRSYVLGPHGSRRIVARRVAAPRTRPLARSREAAAQDCTRSRRCAPSRGESLWANVGPAHRRDVASIPTQRLLMIRPGRRSVTERPRTLGNRSTIDYHQTTRQGPRATRRIKRHRPAWWMDSHHSYWSPRAAGVTTRRPSPTEGVVVPGAAVIGEPAPGIARNPGIAEGRVVGPITGAIGIPTRSNTGGHPHVALTLHWIPISVGIQVIPVFALRIRRVIAHRRLL